MEGSRLRKIVIGLDFMNNAMHYQVGQDVLGGSHRIHSLVEKPNGDVHVYIINDDNEVKRWKRVTATMPFVSEDNINF